ncbi:MAG: methyl-accepting chemotaxis protein [Lachnospiraceae bacterium]|nr:methyl-accepting chemotaxis protein [Lachnospiraceae bacterium]
MGLMKKEKVEKVKVPKAPKAPKPEKKGKVPKEKMPKEKKPPKSKEGKSAGKRKGTILTAIMVICIVPVVLMIALGVVSYITASNAILTQTKDSALATVSAVADYTNLVCNTIATKGTEVVSNKDVSGYYTKYYKDPTSADAKAAMSNIKAFLNQTKQSNQYIASYTFIPEKGDGVSTLVGNYPADVWEQFKASPEGSEFLSSGKIAGWKGYHEFVDDTLVSDPAGYGFAYFRKMLQNNTILVMGLTMQEVKDTLVGMDMGEGSIKAMVSADGREIGVESDKVFIDPDDSTITAEYYGLGTQEHGGQYFVGTWFHEQTKDSKVGGYLDVEVDGKPYFYFYSPVGTTGIMLCTLVPQDNLLAQARSIAYITIAFVVIAVVIALGLGVSIAIGIRKTLNGVVGGLKKVGAGDLTVTFKTNRKDEFMQLTEDLNQTLSGIRGLIQDTRNFGEQVNQMSGELAIKTADINESMKQVMQAVEEVSEGTQNQASETENSNMKMISLAENLTDISDQTEVMEKMADNVMKSVESGNQIMTVLNEKSDTAAEITKELSEEIMEVEARSKEIQGIIGVINSIAEQTNLLSLNASIEAARAGEAGRGFSVVADEIRKLAEQSKESANQIKKIVEGITETTNRTSESAKSAETMMQEQTEALRDTVAIFHSISDATTELVDKLHVAGDNMERIMVEKENVGDSLQNIAAISQQAAASVEEINATLNEEMMTITHLSEEAEALREQMAVMNESMEKFQV